MNRTTCIVAALVTLSACALDRWDPPIQPSPGHPCGVGTLCATQHTCCPQYSTCGGEPESVGCPAGMCCDIGSIGVGHVDAGTMMMPMRPVSQ